MAQQPTVSTPQLVEQPPTWWRRTLRHLGSTIALILGTMGFIGALSAISGGDGDAAGGTLTSSIVMILGGLAYRSAKRRRLGEVPSTPARRVLEGVAIVLMLMSVLLLKNLAYLIMTEPVPHFVIPLWALVAYLLVALWPRQHKQG